jgi:hypothetical protein
MSKKYPSPIKAIVEGLFVISAVLIVACSYYGSFDLFNAHPVIIIAIFCGVALLWYRSKNS